MGDGEEGRRGCHKRGGEQTARAQRNAGSAHRPRRRAAVLPCHSPLRTPSHPSPTCPHPITTPPSRAPSPPLQEDATEYVPQVLARVKPEYLRRAYKIAAWEDHEDFLAQLARQTGGQAQGRAVGAGDGE